MLNTLNTINTFKAHTAPLVCGRYAIIDPERKPIKRELSLYRHFQRAGVFYLDQGSEGLQQDLEKEVILIWNDRTHENSLKVISAIM